MKTTNIWTKEAWANYDPEKEQRLGVDMNVIAQEPVIRRSGGVFTVKLQSRGNPDFRQDPYRSVYGVPDVEAHVQTLKEARDLCRAYISYFDLGGGNWTGGQIVRVSDGLVIGHVSYNGRVWACSSGREWTAETKEIKL